jgi:Cu+-exporting ATPase
MNATIQAKPGTVDLTVDGMTCGNCARHVREALQAVPGVAEARVSLDDKSARVRFHESIPANSEALIDAAAAAGYEARISVSTSAGEAPKKSPSDEWRFTALLGVFCTLPLLIAEWIFQAGMNPGYQWLAFALSLPVQIIGGARFYRGAWNQLRIGGSNMDTLVALGSTTAFVYSVWGLFARVSGHLYFMEAASIITLVSVGHWLESRMSAKAASSLRALLTLAPETALKLDPQTGAATRVEASQLVAGDIIRLAAGERVATDSVIVRGGSSVDESMLTGESMPVDKEPGAPIYGGTLNLTGAIEARVTATGDRTALASIIAAVERAQNSRAGIQRIADRVSGIFVPIVVAIALASALTWGLAFETASRLHAFFETLLWHSHLPETALAAAVIHAAAVLIIACPCAMGLATPAAIMAGTNAAARRGILIRDGSALEKAGTISAALFDKTGTLTQGKPAVSDQLVLVEKVTGVETVRLAASLARRSNHPLSRGIAALAKDDSPLENVSEIRGSGVQCECMVGNQKITLRLGSLRWLKENGVSLEPAAEFTERCMQSGATILGFSVDHQLAAAFSLRDPLKPGAREIPRLLEREGIPSYLITGDNWKTARAIAAECGIPEDRVFAEVRPEEKAARVAELRKTGLRVAFIGDGINDAPALEQADLGIAVSQASDVAREAADIILLRSDIEAIPEAIGLARATLRTIKQNLFWAFFYNALGIPLAALGFLSPVICAAAMGFSDVVVIGNALRLNRWRRSR